MNGPEGKVRGTRMGNYEQRMLRWLGRRASFCGTWGSNHGGRVYLLRFQVCGYLYSATEVHLLLAEHRCHKSKRHAMQCNVHVSLLLVVCGIFHGGCALRHILSFRAATCDRGARPLRLIPLGKLTEAPA